MPVTAELTIRADTWDARRAVDWLEAAALERGVPADEIVRLDHCLDEALANIIAHGGPGALAAPVELQLHVRRADGTCTAELSVVDEGVAFDAAAVARNSVPRAASLAEAMPGGLGLLMTLRFSDDLRYRRSGDRNHLTIAVNWTEAA